LRCAILNEIGMPLIVEDLQMPKPKFGEVLVKVEACGVCHTDLHVMKGEVKFPTPAVLGHEISGVIESIGDGVQSLKRGDPVVCPFIIPCGECYHCVRGRDDLCEKFYNYNRLQGKLYDGETRLFRENGSPVWMYSMGGLAEYAVVPRTAVFKLPPNLPLKEAAILGCGVFTAYGAAKNQGEIRPGETVAIVAVGGVGMNLVNMARIFGASEIIAVDVRRDKLEAATKFGATHVIESNKADVISEVMRITDGRGVDVAFECLGTPETVVQALNTVRDGGRVVIVGIAPAGATAAFEITKLVRREIKVMGSYGARVRTDMPEILTLAQRGVIDLTGLVSRRFLLPRADEAYSALAKGEIIGRAIVTMT
jgi:S-(hydroxymethyl)glutathione dehydrogenase/alcohol dehydrogenase